MWMQQFSFLEYVNRFSQENLLIVERAALVKDRREFACIANVSLGVVRGWFIEDDQSKRKRVPSLKTWNTLLYRLEARRLGCSSIESVDRQ